MPHVHDVVLLLDVDGVMEALTARFQTQVLAVCVGHMQPLLRMLFLAYMSNGLNFKAGVEGVVSFLFLGGACSAYCR